MRTATSNWDPERYSADPESDRYRKPLTEGEKRTIHRRAEEGDRLIEVARDLGRHYHTVRREAKRGPR